MCFSSSVLHIIKTREINYSWSNGRTYNLLWPQQKQSSNFLFQQHHLVVYDLIFNFWSVFCKYISGLKAALLHSAKCCHFTIKAQKIYNDSVSPTYFPAYMKHIPCYMLHGIYMWLVPMMMMMIIIMMMMVTFDLTKIVLKDKKVNIVKPLTGSSFPLS